MKTIYISIPITGFDIETQKRLAEQHKARLRAEIEDCQVTTPFDINRELNHSDGYYMGRDVHFIIDHADTVFFCKGWHNSRGCQTEMVVAKLYGKDMMFE